MEINSAAEMLQTLLSTFSRGFVNLYDIINYLVGALLTIEITLFGLWWAFGETNAVPSLIKKVFFISIWLWIINNFPVLAQEFVEYLIGAGFTAGGGSVNDSHRVLMDPAYIAGMGIDAVQYIFESISIWSIGESILMALVALITFFAFIVIAGQLIIALVEFYIIVGVSGILLPFGLMKASRFMSEKVLGAVIAHGIKLMIIAFIIAVVRSTMEEIVPSQEVTLIESLSILFISIVLAWITCRVPDVAAGFLSGAPTLSAERSALDARRTNAFVGRMGQQVAQRVAQTKSLLEAGAAAGVKMGYSAGTAGKMGFQASRAAGDSAIKTAARTGVCITKGGAHPAIQAIMGPIKTIEEIKQSAREGRRMGREVASRSIGKEQT